MKSFDLMSLDTVPGSSAIAREVLKMEEARRIWTRHLQPANLAADQLRAVMGSNSVAALSKQLQEFERIESIKNMLDPLAHIHKSLMDSGVARMLEDFARLGSVGHGLARIAKEASLPDGVARAIQESMQSSLAHAQQAIATASIGGALSQVMKTYKEAQRQWTVPDALVSSVGALKAMQEEFGKLTLPVMDWASAATLAKVLGPEGIEAQLAALGIEPDGSLAEEEPQQGVPGIGISRSALELMTLLSFILAVLVPFYQEVSSREWQQQTDKKLADQTLTLESQARRFEALSVLVEKALVQEAKRAGVRFVVLDRVAIVRDEPRHGSTVVGKLLPREVVKLVSEQGRWIQIEYYHWLAREYQTGWVLKKYFKRVPATYTEDNAQPKQ